MLYASPHLRGNDTLCKSGRTVTIWLLGLFITSQIVLLDLLFDLMLLSISLLACGHHLIATRCGV